MCVHACMCMCVVNTFLFERTVSLPILNLGNKNNHHWPDCGKEKLVVLPSGLALSTADFLTVNSLFLLSVHLLWVPDQDCVVCSARGTDDLWVAACQSHCVWWPQWVFLLFLHPPHWRAAHPVCRSRRTQGRITCMPPLPHHTLPHPSHLKIHVFQICKNTLQGWGLSGSDWLL